MFIHNGSNNIVGLNNIELVECGREITDPANVMGSPQFNETLYQTNEMIVDTKQQLFTTSPQEDKFMNGEDFNVDEN